MGHAGALRLQIALIEGVWLDDEGQAFGDTNAKLLQCLFLRGFFLLALGFGTGDDTLNVNYATGDPIPNGGVNFIGGTGFDLMSITGTGTQDVNYVPSDQPGTDGNAGDFYVNQKLIHFRSKRSNQTSHHQTRISIGMLMTKNSVITAMLTVKNSKNCMMALSAQSTKARSSAVQL